MGSMQLFTPHMNSLASTTWPWALYTDADDDNDADADNYDNAAWLP